jgi:hypothetical protein
MVALRGRGIRQLISAVVGTLFGWATSGRTPVVVAGPNGLQESALGRAEEAPDAFYRPVGGRASPRGACKECFRAAERASGTRDPKVQARQRVTVERWREDGLEVRQFPKGRAQGRPNLKALWTPCWSLRTGPVTRCAPAFGHRPARRETGESDAGEAQRTPPRVRLNAPYANRRRPNPIYTPRRCWRPHPLP